MSLLPELQPYLLYIGGAAAVLVGLILLTFIFRALRKSPRGGKGERLGIREFCEIDDTRRLVLVRRDKVEHLIMIGGPQDLVIESGIGAEKQAKHPVDVAIASAQQGDEIVPFRAAPRPPIFGTRRPTLRAVDDTIIEGDGPKLA